MFDILALVASLLISPAQAQNPTCPTRPPSDSSNACASTAFVQRSASIPSVAIESFGGGCSATVADNTAALLAAVASVPNGVRVTFNKACTYNFTQAGAIRFQKAVYLQGTSMNATFLNFIPTTNGIFLQWLPPIQYGWIFGGGVKDLTLYSTDSTHTKAMIDEAGWSNWDAINVNCGVGPNQSTTVVTGGTGSYCFKIAGWQFVNLETVWLEADIPLFIGKNPYFLGNDHFHFHNIVLVGTNAVGNFQLVQVDGGASFYDMTWDGYQSWNNGSTGFSYDQTGVAVNYWQAATTPGTGYAVGDVVTVTPGAGGACTVNPKILIVAVSGGAVTHASVQSPFYGTCASLPAASDWSQASTTGVGTGLVSTIGKDASNNIRFSNLREEGGQAGTPANNWTIAWNTGSITQNFIVENTVLQGAMNGLLLTNVRNITIQNSTTFGGAASPVAIVNVATNSDNVLFLNNSWYPSANYSIAMGSLNKVWSLPNWLAGGNDIPASGFWSSQIVGAQVVRLGIDTAVGNGTYTQGPSVAVATNSKWFVSAQATLTDTVAAGYFQCRLTDTASNIYAEGSQSSSAANKAATITLSAVVDSPASGSFAIACTDVGLATGKMLVGTTGGSASTQISAIQH